MADPRHDPRRLLDHITTGIYYSRATAAHAVPTTLILCKPSPVKHTDDGLTSGGIRTMERERAVEDELSLPPNARFGDLRGLWLPLIARHFGLHDDDDGAGGRRELVVATDVRSGGYAVNVCAANWDVVKSMVETKGARFVVFVAVRPPAAKARACAVM